MIKGFEKETADLTYKEKLLLPIFIDGLIHRNGKKAAITSEQMQRRILLSKGIKINGSRIRKIINHIRLYNLVPRLLATSSGYYVSDDKAEILDYIESLNQRIESIQAVRDALSYQLENLNK